MATEYNVIIRDLTGQQVGFLTGQDATLHSVSATRKANAVGTATIEVEGSYFQSVPVSRDFQVEIRRRNIADGIDWYTEWIGLVSGVRRSTDIPGNRTAIIRAKTYLWLLRRRWIAYLSKTAYTIKSAPAETVIKAYVNENAGPGASSVDRKFASGPYLGFTIEADLARGATWTGEKAQVRLLETIAGIADSYGLYFDIEVTSSFDYVFKVYSGQRGTDRSTIGLVNTTGLNGAGNTPVIFSTDFGNMVSPFYDVDYSDSANVILAIGAGAGEARPVRKKRKSKKPKVEELLATTYGIQTLSPWDDMEEILNASNLTTPADLDQAALTTVVQRRAKESFGFTVLQQENSLYGKHYFFGDLITARYEELETSLMLSEAKISFAPGQKEQLSFVFQDVSGDD